MRRPRTKVAPKAASGVQQIDPSGALDDLGVARSQTSPRAGTTSGAVATRRTRISSLSDRDISDLTFAPEPADGESVAPS